MVSRSRRTVGRRSRHDEDESRGLSRINVAVVLTVLGAAFLAALWGWSADEQPPERAPLVAGAGPGSGGDEETRREVQRVLWAIRGNWTAHARRRAIHDDSNPVQLRYEPTLRDVLADPENPLFRAAVMLAVEQGITRLVPNLRTTLAIAGDEDKNFLVREIDRLEHWRDDELLEMLQGDSRGLILGALGVVAGRQQRPVDELVSLLVHDDRAIRLAALEALPATLSKEVGEKIIIAQDFVPMSRVGEALAALTRCPSSPAIEDALYAALEQRSRHGDLVLDALQKRGTPLTRPRQVFEVVRDPFLPVATRARAILCLEVTRTPGAADYLEPLQFDHAVLEYLAARILLRAQRPAGITRLLAIFDDRYDAYDGDDVETLQEARVGARQILALLANTSLYEDVSVWEKWAEGRMKVTVGHLPPVPVSLGGFGS